jgi:hypothetical protein
MRSAFEPLPVGALDTNIDFLHPGYPDEIELRTVLLSLPVADLDHENRLGVVHAVAYEACKIIANNFPGFPSVSAMRDAPTQIPGTPHHPDPLTVLTSGSYYYHALDSSPEPYPICTSFQAWTPLSTRDIPPEWRRDQAKPDVQIDAKSRWELKSIAVKDVDKECCITQWHSVLQTAHLVPAAEVDWVSVCAPSQP